MSENTQSAKCTQEEWDLARAAGLLIGTTSEEIALHKFAESIRAALATKPDPAEPVGRFAVVNIGCIECGVSSAIVGTYADRTVAEAVRDACAESLHWREGGQNEFSVFDLAASQADEYREVIEAAARAVLAQPQPGTTQGEE